MFESSQSFLRVASIGQAFMLSLAFTGVMQLAATLYGTPLSPQLGGRLFVIGSLLTGPLAAYFQTARFLLVSANENQLPTA